MKLSILFSIIFLFFLSIVLAVALFFLQKPQDIRQHAAGPTTYGNCVASAPGLQTGLCFADPNSCATQGLTQYYSDIVPAAITICGQNGFTAGLAHGTAISCCPTSTSYTNTYGACGGTTPGVCTTNSCVGTPIFTDTVPTQCLFQGYQAGVLQGTKTYCCSLPPSPPPSPTPTPTPTIVPCGGTQCGTNFACGPVVTVAGRVTDIITGSGVAGLSILINDNNRHNNPPLYSRYTDSVTTNANGNFTETALVCGGLGVNYGDAYSVYPDWATCIPGFACTNPNPVYLAPGQQANKPGVPDCAKNASCNFTVTLATVKSARVSFGLSGIGLGGNSNPQTKTRSYKLSFSPHLFASALLAQNTSSKVLGAQITTLTGTATFDAASGSFQDNNLAMNAVAPGQYDVILHVDGSLDKFMQPLGGGTYFNIIPGQSFSAVQANLSGGDIAPPPTGDNFVDIQDYNAMLTCLSSATCPSRTLADLNDDGVVDIKDLQILMSSFGDQGASFSTQKFNCVTDPGCNTSGSTMQFCQLICTIQTGP